MRMNDTRFSSGRRQAAYTIQTDGTDEPFDAVAEKISDLAHAIRQNPSDLCRVVQSADAIMHLAADVKLAAERKLPPTQL